METPINPARLKSVEALFKRVARAAEARGIPFTWSVTERTRSLGPAFRDDAWDMSNRPDVKPRWVRCDYPARSILSGDEAQGETYIKTPYLTDTWKGHPDSFYEACDVMLTQTVIVYEHGDLTNQNWTPLAIVRPDPTSGEGPGGPSQVKSFPLDPQNQEVLVANWPKIFLGHCDHCDTKRNRNDTVMVMDNDSQEVRQIGRNCLFEYTGMDPTLLLQFYECSQPTPEGSASGGWRGYRRDDILFSTRQFIRLATRVYSANGYAKGIMRMVFDPTFAIKQKGGQAWATRQHKEGGKMVTRWVVPMDSTENTAAREASTITWLDNIEPKGNSYLMSLKEAWLKSHVGKSDCNLLASAYTAHDRTMLKARRDAERVEREAEQPDRVFFPAPPKERVKVGVRVQVVHKRQIQGHYGVSTLVVMECVDRPTSLKWFSSGASPPLDAEVTLTAFTIKKHSEYQGRKETQVNRVVWE